MNRTLLEEKLKLDRALYQFRQEMRTRLREKAEEGWRGWDDLDQREVIVGKLEEELSDHIVRVLEPPSLENLDKVDVANLLMFLWWQENRE